VAPGIHAALGFILVLGVGAGRVAIAPTTSRPMLTAIAAAAPAPTSTSLPSIRNRIPVPPSTVPLQTRAPSAHISPVFPALSGAGFFLALVIMTTRFVMTRPRRRQRA
jgi:hypothetical protein